MEIAKARFTFMRHSVITANAVMRNLRLLYLGLILRGVAPTSFTQDNSLRN